MKYKNIIGGCVLIVVAVAYLYYATLLPERTLPNTPGPAFFPYIIGSLLLAFAIALLVQGLFFTADGRALTRSDMAKYVGGSLGLFLVYLIVLPFLGFLLSSLPFFAALMWLYGERRPVWVVGGSVGITLFLYVVFRHVFLILLPQGVLRGIVP